MNPRPTPYRPRLRALALLAAVSAAGCSLFYSRPTVRIADVALTSLGVSGATAQVELAVVNPNGFELRGDDLRYALAYADDGPPDGDESWTTLAEGTHPSEIRIPANDTASLRLEIPFRYSDLGRAVGNLLRDGELRYRVRGDVRFSGPLVSRRVPFDERGVLER